MRTENKTVVPKLLIDGELISQLDITSAHPSTLPRLMIEGEKKFKVYGGIEEAKKLTEELESGRLYDSLAMTLRITSTAAKERFLAPLNGKDNHTQAWKIEIGVRNRGQCAFSFIFLKTN